MNCTLTGDRIDVEDVGDWTVSKSLTGGIQAKVQLCSPKGKYSIENVDLRGALIVIKATVNAVEYEMFTGRVRSIGEVYEIQGEEKVDIDCSSIMSLAYRRPITAETMNGTGETIIKYLLRDYGGLDDCWIGNIEDNGTNFTFVNFSENSIIAGIRKLCEACRIELFVNKEGKLVTQAKKDFGDPVEYTFTQNDIYQISRTITELEVPSVCRVRGRYIAFTEAGTENYVPDGSYDAVADSTSKMILRIRPSTALTDAMALQAIVTITSGATNGEVLGLKDGDLFIQFDGIFMAGAINTVEFEVTGPSYRVEEFVDAAVRALGEGLNENIHHKDSSGITFPFTTYDRNNPDTQMLKHYDEANTHRIEVVTSDGTLLGQHGINYMAHDNIYIQNTVDAQLIGARCLFEKSLSRSKLAISGPFNPNVLEPNMIIECPLMYRGTDIVKGLLTAISFNYKQDPRAFDVSYEVSAQVPAYTYEEVSSTPSSTP